MACRLGYVSKNLLGRQWKSRSSPTDSAPMGSLVTELVPCLWQECLTTRSDVDKFRKDSKRWSTVTFHRLTNLYQNISQRETAGIEEFTMFLCYNEKHELPWFRDLYSDFKVLTAAEAGLPSRLQTVWSFTTFCIQPLKYLQWLTLQFRELGGLIVQSKVNSLK